MPDDLKDNLTDKGTWIRLLEVLLFVAIFGVVEVVAAVVVILQFLIKLVTGEANARLRGFGCSLGSYCYQMIAFMCFHSDEMPYPFAPWPAGPVDPDLKAAAPAARPARRPRSPAAARTGRRPASRGAGTTGGEEH